jgi:hypothetical protein
MKTRKHAATLNVGGIEINREEYKIVKDGTGNRFAEKGVRVVLPVGFKARESVQTRRNPRQSLGQRSR